MLSRADRIRLINIKFQWLYKGKAYTSKVESMCPLCGATAVIKLPAPIRKEQPDDTTHVCHPSAGGCNHGFAEDALLAQEAKEASPCTQ